MVKIRFTNTLTVNTCEICGIPKQIYSEMRSVTLVLIFLISIVLSQDTYYVCDNNDVDKYEDISADEGDLLFEVSTI